MSLYIRVILALFAGIVVLATVFDYIRTQRTHTPSPLTSGKANLAFVNKGGMKPCNGVSNGDINTKKPTKDEKPSKTDYSQYRSLVQ
jgi:hypothetical protein